ncbi:MAG: family 43 glycosylhydrolase [Defluviitaleaceae bacterium]|nr:family 43 glycosylhydrolase [Defluviitaleaceae bacterium]MCL2275610.1 family 43 glycosylhydrolase [Defluviitaleaceae bacterium]
MKKFLCNPLPLPYRYQAKKSNHGADMFREGADPTLVRFKGVFYLFVSMNGGFWFSQDLYSWQFKETPELPIYDYAPDVHEVNGRLIFSASKGGEPCPFYASGDPINEPFEKVAAHVPFWDPALFQDDDGRVYFFWGCGNEDPLWGCEVDGESFAPISEKVAVIQARHDIHGWERHGENAETPHLHPYIEGAFVNKYNGKYYLQYAAPGTELNTYADGVYVADTPLGPYKYQAHNPISPRPGGFITAAGHGSTFTDDAGNWWHISTMRISVNEIFERRLGLFPCEIDADGLMHCNMHFADYPFALPEGKRTDMHRTVPYWNLLSYNKMAMASSFQAGFEPQFGTNEDIRTWWAAHSGDASPWFQIELNGVCRVAAVQVNFADHQVKMPRNWEHNENAKQHGRVIYSDRGGVAFLLEGSTDGVNWITLKDTRNAPQDNPHDFIVLAKSADLRYVRISHISRIADGVAAISGLRIFGVGNGTPPAAVDTNQMTVARTEDGMDTYLRWQTVENADGYNVRYGISPEKLYNSWQVFGKNEVKLTTLDSGRQYFAAVDSFNENGVTAGEIIQID